MKASRISPLFSLSIVRGGPTRACHSNGKVHSNRPRVPRGPLPGLPPDEAARPRVLVVGNTVLALLKNPEQMARLRDDARLVRSATEEGLRYDGAAQLLQRIAREDLTLRGKTIRQGDLIYLAVASANRDPAMFNGPDQFDVGRTDNRHLAFGTGPHVCLGMTLARRELDAALRRLVQRMPRLHVDPERPTRRRANSLVFRGLESLPVRFD
jgi:cytochrome P450